MVHQILRLSGYIIIISGWYSRRWKLNTCTCMFLKPVTLYLHNQRNNSLCTNLWLENNFSGQCHFLTRCSSHPFALKMTKACILTPSSTDWAVVPSDGCVWRGCLFGGSWCWFEHWWQAYEEHVQGSQEEEERRRKAEKKEEREKWEDVKTLSTVAEERRR